jgi:uncharacterized delta-60 repeat protein
MIRGHLPTFGGVLVAASLFGIGPAFGAPGDLDPGFGEGGLAPLTRTGKSAVAQQADGKLLVVGAYDSTPAVTYDFLADGYDFAVVRLEAGGTMDAGFGVGGAAIADYAGFLDIPYAVALQPDGKIVLAGRVFLSGGIDYANPGGDIGLARFNADGTLDATFGNGGWAVIDLGGFDDAAYCVIPQSGNRLVLGVSTNEGGIYHLAFLRVTGTGEVDATFGTADGITSFDFAISTRFFSYDAAIDCAPQSTGKLVWVAVGASSSTGQSGIGVARLTVDGMRDPSFGTEGLLTLPIEGSRETVTSIAIQPNDAIVTAGFELMPEVDHANAVLRRLSPDGIPDATFGSGGKVIADLGTESAFGALVALGDGTIVATGGRVADEFGRRDTILTRFTAAGELDTGFGIDGVAVADFGAGDHIPSGGGHDLIRQTDGKYVAVGGLYVARFDDNANWPGRVGFTSTLRSADESEGSVSHTVRRTGGRSGAITVNYATSAGEAQPGADFESISGTLFWSDGEANEQMLTVDLIDDGDGEQPENFFLSLTDPTGGALLAANEATSTIENDDRSFAFISASATVSEQDSQVVVWVERNDPEAGAGSVMYSISDGSATAGSDFTSTSGTLTWASGGPEAKSIYISISDDPQDEADETFAVSLANPTGGFDLGPNSVATVTIVDNDSSGGGGGGGTLAWLELLGLAGLAWLGRVDSRRPRAVYSRAGILLGRFHRGYAREAAMLVHDKLQRWRR